jgi:hypothetical protein
MRFGAFLILLALACAVGCLANLEQARSVTGVVGSAGQPVQGARVRFKGEKPSTSTDVEGRFRLADRGSRLTAWKEGYLIGGVATADQPLRIELRPLPTEDNEDYAWVDPRPSREREHNCANCHGTIFDEWAGSAHGKGLKNRHFLNLYDGSDWHGQPGQGWSLLQDNPNGASVCAACHAPSVPLSDPGYDDFRKLKGVHALGIHCDYCHKIANARTDKLGLEHGRFALDLLRPKAGQLFFGPLDDVDRGEDAYAPLYHKSAYCASCHEGTIFGVPVYTTYSEWLASPARKQGKECRDCHLTPTGKLTNVAPGKGGIERDPLTLASHAMPGGDLAMLKRCLNVDVRHRKEGDALVLTVTTTATGTEVGHRVPTGFIDRHLLLVVEATQADGRAIESQNGPRLPVEAGVSKPAEGGYAGLPGRYFAKQLVGEQGERPAPFWRSVKVSADTRLHPGVPEQDKWTFPHGVSQVRVRLIYRRFHRQVVREKAWPDKDLVVVDRTLVIK